VYHPLDVTDARALERFDLDVDSLDVLVHSQGIAVYQRAEFDMETFRQVLEVNLISVMALSTKFRDRLAASQGRMIVISSVGAYQATMGNPAYSASKSGVTGLTRTLAQAWIGDGIRVNGIAPGYIVTRMTEVTVANPARREKAIARIPAGRLGEPDDVAGVALFLASDLAKFVVGQTIIVDGGMLL
jgi:3-oxoacyl-[acyl-carrier protein] reductase